MLDWLKKEQTGGRTGIVRSADGMAIARISRGKGQLPHLEHCRFIARGGRGEQSGQSEVLRELRTSRQACSWVLSPEDYQLVLVEAPDVDPSELRAAVRWRIRDLIDFHVDDAALDVFDVPAQRAAGPVRMMYVVVCRAQLIQSVVDTLEGANFNLQIIDIAELALRNIAALLEEDADGVALLHLERDHGLITITRQANLYLARKLEIGFGQLLEAFAADDSEPELPGPALRPLLEQIVLEVQRSLDYFESHLSSSPAMVLYVDPPVGLPPQVTEFFQQNLGVQARPLDLNSLLGGVQLDPETQSRALLAIGAALRMETSTL